MSPDNQRVLGHALPITFNLLAFSSSVVYAVDTARVGMAYGAPAPLAAGFMAVAFLPQLYLGILSAHKLVAAKRRLYHGQPAKDFGRRSLLGALRLAAPPVIFALSLAIADQLAPEKPGPPPAGQIPQINAR